MSDPSHKDFWDPKAYAASGSFVPQLASKLLQYLDPQPTERVLDVGCGDGNLTSQFSSRTNSVLGIDGSPMMIEAATRDFAGPEKKAEFRVVDCRYLEQEGDVVNGGFDKVVTNSALHWILRDEKTRVSTLRGIHSSLKPGGRFIFETGGHGHVHEALTALTFTLLNNGISLEKAKELNPFFTPSETWMRQTLEGLGFEIEKIEVEYRPTKMTPAADGGLAGWIKLFGAAMLDGLSEDKRDEAVKQICDVLEPLVTREDGSQWLGYVRLRGVARKGN